MSKKKILIISIIITIAFISLIGVIIYFVNLNNNEDENDYNNDEKSGAVDRIVLDLYNETNEVDLSYNKELIPFLRTLEAGVGGIRLVDIKLNNVDKNTYDSKLNEESTSDESRMEANAIDIELNLLYDSNTYDKTQLNNEIEDIVNGLSNNIESIRPEIHKATININVNNNTARFIYERENDNMFLQEFSLL